jgi:2-keto-3-deoxy-L-rhamnonate aldolase RhmA
MIQPSAGSPGLASLKEKLASRQKTVATMMSQLFYTDLPAMYKGSGAVDFLLFDLEHGSYNPENIGDLLFASRRADLPVIIRVQDCEYHCISKPLDMGADGIMIPRTETLSQVELAVQSMRFFPKGKKGAGGRGLLRPGESTEDFNRNRLLFLQIESPLGVANLDEMLRVYGEEVAGVIIGPCDMAITSGCGLDTDAPAVLENIRKVIAVCKAREKSCGMFMDASSAARWAGEGMNILWITTEIGLLAVGLQDLSDKVRDL